MGYGKSVDITVGRCSSSGNFRDTNLRLNFLQALVGHTGARE